ncbi:MAG TPA: hypothetical protein VLE73_05760 [Candidatus Saccharimonadales bacterium]|nr:hypothetical protein [Candidatus Saccharimonadales bacterium]
MDNATAVSTAAEQFPEDRLLDVIIYTASLVSDLRSIDSELNILRQITARTGGSFNDRDKADLYGIQQKLEQTLVNQEQFRTFSYDTLRAHILRHFSRQAIGSARRLAWALVGIVMVALVVALGFFMLSQHLPNNARNAVSLSLFYLVLYSGSAALLASARKEVGKEVRQAYGYLAAALFCVALVTPIQPLIGIFIPKSPLGPTIMTATLALAYIPFYLGARKLALLIGVQSRLTSYSVIAILVVGAAALYASIALITAPFRSGPLTTPYVISVTISHGLLMLNLAVSAFLLAKAHSRMSFLYARSINALTLAPIVNVAVCLYFLVYWYAGNGIATDNLYLDIGAVVLTIVSALYLRAGYLFKRTHLN